MPIKVYAPMPITSHPIEFSLKHIILWNAIVGIENRNSFHHLHQTKQKKNQIQAPKRLTNPEELYNMAWNTISIMGFHFQSLGVSHPVHGTSFSWFVPNIYAITHAHSTLFNAVWIEALHANSQQIYWTSEHCECDKYLWKIFTGICCKHRSSSNKNKHIFKERSKSF